MRVYKTHAFPYLYMKRNDGFTFWLQDFTGKEKGIRYEFVPFFSYFLIGSNFSRPPMNGLNTSGIITLPSAC